MEMLRETREEVRGLSTQLHQLQVQQAAANSSATAASSPTVINELEVVANVTDRTKQGENTLAVPAPEVLDELIRRIDMSGKNLDEYHEMRTMSGNPASGQPEHGSTVEG